MHKNQLIVISVIVLALGGCATTNKVTPETIDEKCHDIGYSDGIDKDEAILLAQQYLIRNGLNADFDVSKIIKVDEGDWDEDHNVWVIYFGAKRAGNGDTIITVSKYLGEAKRRTQAQ